MKSQISLWLWLSLSEYLLCVPSCVPRLAVSLRVAGHLSACPATVSMCILFKCLANLLWVYLRAWVPFHCAGVYEGLYRS